MAAAAGVCLAAPQLLHAVRLGKFLFAQPPQVQPDPRSRPLAAAATTTDDDDDDDEVEEDEEEEEEEEEEEGEADAGCRSAGGRRDPMTVARRDTWRLLARSRAAANADASSQGSCGVVSPPPPPPPPPLPQTPLPPGAGLP